jgi:iron(III) transport system substrate-binding protein
MKTDVIASRRSRRSNLLMLASVFAMACSPESPPERQEPVVVYAAFEDDSHLVDIFDRYKEETGVLVIVRRGPAGKIVDDLINNNISPPADVLMTVSVLDAWRAAEESALRPLYAEAVSGQLPEWAMDPDMLWFALATDHAVIAYRGNEPAATDLVDLTHEQFHGQLCLSSSANTINRAVIAILIDQLGVRSAEIVVREWVRNLAVPPFTTDAELLGAIADERCAIGIAAHSAAARSDVAFLQPDALYADIEAIGVARHARNPEGAAALVEWLVTEIANVQTPGDQNTSRHNVALLARHHEDAVKLAERARYP